MRTKIDKETVAELRDIVTAIDYFLSAVQRNDIKAPPEVQAALEIKWVRLSKKFNAALSTFETKFDEKGDPVTNDNKIRGKMWVKKPG